MSKWTTGWALLVLALAGCDSGDNGTTDAAARETTPPQGSAAQTPPANITRDRLLAADGEPGNWFTTGRDFGKTHHSPLTDINTGNVDRLGLAWEYETFTRRGLQATPIVVDGVMYVSGPFGKVFAINAETGEEVWYFDPQADGQHARYACCGVVNRGVAVWKGKVYVGALDGRLIALDAASGDKLWEANTFIYPERGYASTGAPEVAGNVVVIGNAGAEFDARGYVSAYDLDTGELKWRFFIVPRDPAEGQEHPELEMAARTWDPNSRWDIGLGGTVWDGMVYDPELNLLYIGTGNANSYNQDERSPSGGDNLFTSSVLAINPDTGRLAWHYQETPGDQWDFDSDQPMILTDLTVGGEAHKVLLHAPKNGFFYVLDRETGKLLSARNIVPVNWAKGIDPETGRAILNKEAADYGDGLKLVFPSPAGGHSWNPMAYSADTGLVYIPAIEMGMYTTDTSQGQDHRPRQHNMGVAGLMTSNSPFGDAMPAEDMAKISSGGLLEGAPDPTPRGVLKAWDPVAQKAVWELESAGWWDRAGVLSTGGGLIFQGTGTGYFRAIDARTGKILKEIKTGTAIVAAPATYRINGVQYVAVAAAGGGIPLTMAPPADSGNAIYGNDGRIIVFKLDGGETPVPAKVERAPVPEPPIQTADAETIARGEAVFSANCRACHTQVPGSVAPDLRHMTAATHAEFKDIVLGGKRRSLGMPQWDDLLNDEDANAVHAYIISLAWDAYRAQQENSN